MVKLNLTSIGTSPTPLDEGIYQGVFTGHTTVLESKNSGQPYVNLEFTLDGPTGVGGRKAWQICSLQAQSLWAFKKAALTLGVDESDLDKDFDVDELLKANYGAKVDLRLIVENVRTKTGEMELRNKIAALAGLGMMSEVATAVAPF